MTSQEKVDLINKHIKYGTSDLRHASIKYWAETGNITGSVWLSLQDMMDEVWNTAIDEAAEEAESNITYHSGDYGYPSAEINKESILKLKV